MDVTVIGDAVFMKGMTPGLEGSGAIGLYCVKEGVGSVAVFMTWGLGVGNSGSRGAATVPIALAGIAAGAIAEVLSFSRRSRRLCIYRA